MNDFTAIYQEYQPKIHRYLRNLVGEADALDLTQAAFLKVSLSLATFRRESSLATWIYRIATNVAHDHRGSSLAKQRKAEESLDDESSLVDFPVPATPSTDQAFIRREMNACIRDLVDRLPESYRTVLLLSEFEELSNPAIAEILDVSLDTVKIRLHRARAALRQSMETHCTFYHDERNELMCDRKK